MTFQSCRFLMENWFQNAHFQPRTIVENYGLKDRVKTRFTRNRGGLEREPQDRRRGDSEKEGEIKRDNLLRSGKNRRQPTLAENRGGNSLPKSLKIKGKERKEQWQKRGYKNGTTAMVRAARTPDTEHWQCLRQPIPSRRKQDIDKSHGEAARACSASGYCPPPSGDARPVRACGALSHRPPPTSAPPEQQWRV